MGFLFYQALDVFSYPKIKVASGACVYTLQAMHRYIPYATC